MKKFVAATLVAIMAVLMTAGALAAGNMTLDQAKQAALDRAGVKAEEVQFTKAYQDWDDGRKVFEFEFWKGNTEYDMEVDAATGRVRDYDLDRHGYDFDDAFDYDFDDAFDHDFDDAFDDFFDWFD